MRALADFLLAAYPLGWSGGIFNCRTVRGSSQPSMHGEGRAFDLMLPVVGGKGHPQGHEVVRSLGQVGRDMGVQCVIFDRTIWSARSPEGRPYTGVHPHYDHLHIELTRAAARRMTLSEVERFLAPKTVWEPVSAPEPSPVVSVPAGGEVSAGSISERPRAIPDVRDGWRRHLVRLRRRR